MIPSLNDEISVSEDADGVNAHAMIEETLAHGWQISLPDSGAGSQNQRFTSAWPTPKPLSSKLLPVAPFDIELLPAAVRDWVSDIGTRMCCPIDFPAVATMVGLSSVIGRKAVIRPKERDTWYVVPNLAGGAVGRPGTMKSPAFAAALAPIERLQAVASERFAAAQASFAIQEKLDVMTRKAAEAKAKKLIAGNLRDKAAAELAQAEAQAVATAPPVLRRYKITDASVEALGEILMENPWGTLVYRDELHGLLTSMDKGGGNGARAFYLQAMDGTQSFTFDRIVRGRNLHIEAPCVAMLGGIQPGRIKAYVNAAVTETNDDDGLLQRFSMLIWPDLDPTWVNVDQCPDSAAKARTFATFDRLDQLQPDVDDETGNEVSRIYHFDPPAQFLWNQWHHQLETRLRTENYPPAMESHLAKYRKLVPALALVCALTDAEQVVSLQSLERAIGWASYLETHAARVYASGRSGAMDAAIAIVNKIKAGAIRDGFRAADIYLKGWTGLGDSKTVAEATEILVDLDYLRVFESRPGPQGGRPSVTFQINPLIMEGGLETP